MTQAISLSNILRKNGHEIAHVVVGKSRHRELPSFFTDQIGAPVTKLPSPNFITDRKSKSVKIIRSVIFNILNFRTYLKSVNQIHQICENEQPDAIINFYDFLGGLYFLLKKPSIRHIAVAHQFLLQHSSFEFPKGRLLDKASLKFGNRLAGHGAQKKLALSFQKFNDEINRKLYVVPPLLRGEIKKTVVSKQDYFLVYMVNHGYSEQVERFHSKYPEIPIHCFWDKKDVSEVYEYDNNLTFHQLNDKKFIQMMAGCKGYLTTAGFESVCEAMYMGKPTLMVPVEGHYEQSCNAADAEKAGAGISGKIFDLEILLNYLPEYQNAGRTFHEWCDQTETLFIQNLTDAH